MKFTVDKSKTWKGMSYPLKTSILKDAIDMAKIDTTIHLKYWTPQLHHETYNILECHFWPTSVNVNYDRFYIRAGVVKSQDRKIAEDYLRMQIIPKIIIFMKSKISLLNNFTKLKQDSYFKAVLAGNKILINPQPNI